MSFLRLVWKRHLCGKLKRSLIATSTSTLKGTVCRLCSRGSFNQNETKDIGRVGSWELLCSSFNNHHHRGEDDIIVKEVIGLEVLFCAS